MKNKILGLILLCFLIISGCSANSIEKSSPKDSAKYIKKELNINEEIIEKQNEYGMGIRDTYHIGEDISVIQTDSKEVEQINFSDLDSDEIYNILELIDFPEIDSLSYHLKHDDKDDQVYDNEYGDSWTIFTTYKNIGVSISKKSKKLYETLDETIGNKPYDMQFIYNENRFKDFKDIADN